MIACRVCGNTLQMNQDLSGAVCVGCGVFYPISVLRNLQGVAPANSAPIQQPPQPGPYQQPPQSGPYQQPPFRPAPYQQQPQPGPYQQPPFRPAPYQQQPQPGPNQQPPFRPAPFPQQPQPGPYQQPPFQPGPFPQQPAQPARPQLKNEQFGLSPAEYRKFPRVGGAGFEDPRARAERNQYFMKFYEKTNPQYGKEEWKPYFEDILKQCFPSYTLRKDISISALTSGFANPHVKADFVLGIHPCIVILLSSSQKRARPLGYHALTNAGFRTLVFYTPLSNRRDYVIQRVRKALNP